MLTVTQLINKLLTLYGIGRFITMKLAVFWDVAPYSLVDTDRHFRVHCLCLIIRAMVEA
jgi:hypothetical protein